VNWRRRSDLDSVFAGSALSFSLSLYCLLWSFNAERRWSSFIGAEHHTRVQEIFILRCLVNISIIDVVVVQPHSAVRLVVVLCSKVLPCLLLAFSVQRFQAQIISSICQTPWRSWSRGSRLLSCLFLVVRFQVRVLLHSVINVCLFVRPVLNYRLDCVAFEVFQFVCYVSMWYLLFIITAATLTGDCRVFFSARNRRLPILGLIVLGVADFYSRLFVFICFPVVYVICVDRRGGGFRKNGLPS